MTEVFLDTSYAIALASRRDQHDEKALELAEYIEQQELRKVTTRAVVLEIGNALSTPRFRQTAINMLEYLDHDPTIEIIYPNRSINEGSNYFVSAQTRSGDS